MSALLDKLEALAAKATPGPWDWHESDYGEEIWLGGGGCYTRYVDGPDGCSVFFVGGDHEEDGHKQDVRLVTAFRNALPALLAALRAAEALHRWRKDSSIFNYEHGSPEYLAWFSAGQAVEQTFDAALAALDAKEGA